MQYFIFILLMFWGAISYAQDPLHFALGSCNQLSETEAHWDFIAERDPDFFFWLGDAYYADTLDPIVLREKMQNIYDNPAYGRIRSSMDVIGIWDDHDYGNNDTDRHYPIKDVSQRVYLDFLDEPENSLRRAQQGIYTSYDVGPAKFILLDVRYERDSPDRQRLGDILGESQWAWLEQTIAQSSSQIHFVASGSTVLTPQVRGMEQWSNYPKSQKRLLKLLKQVPGVVLLTGDLHFSGYSRRTRYNREFIELMSSGLSHRDLDSLKKYEWLVNLFWGRRNAFLGSNYSTIEVYYDDPVRMTYSVFESYTNEEQIKINLILNNNGEWTSL